MDRRCGLAVAASSVATTAIPCSPARGPHCKAFSADVGLEGNAIDHADDVGLSWRDDSVMPFMVSTCAPRLRPPGSATALARSGARRLRRLLGVLHRANQLFHAGGGLVQVGGGAFKCGCSWPMLPLAICSGLGQFSVVCARSAASRRLWSAVLHGLQQVPLIRRCP